MRDVKICIEFRRVLQYTPRKLIIILCVQPLFIKRVIASIVMLFLNKVHSPHMNMGSLMFIKCDVIEQRLRISVI